MIDADIHRPIMELSPEDRHDRAKVNEAVRRYGESQKCSTYTVSAAAPSCACCRSRPWRWFGIC
jgi:hypothetical protein